MMNNQEDDLKPYERAQARNEEGDYRIFWATVGAVCTLLLYITVQGGLMLWLVSPVAALSALVVVLGIGIISLSFLQR
jgi:hypothetical protein